MKQLPISAPFPRPKGLIRPSCCANCKHKGEPLQNAQHECRRFPPIPTTFMVNDGKGFVTHTGWPMVMADGWCGEWQPKIEMAN